MIEEERSLVLPNGLKVSKWAAAGALITLDVVLVCLIIIHVPCKFPSLKLLILFIFYVLCVCNLAFLMSIFFAY